MIVNMITSQPRVLLVENTPLEALKIELMLEDLGCVLLKTINNVSEAYQFVLLEKPDIIISDIYLEGELTGIDLKRMLAAYNIPIILITASQELSDYSIATKDSPTTYLVKPFHALSLKSAIDVLIKKLGSENKPKERQSLFVRDYLNNQDRVYCDDILFLHSDRNDCFIHTADKKYVIKRSLSKMATLLDQRFCRIHSSYLINIDFVLKVEAEIVHLTGVQIPLGRSYKKIFLEKISSKKIP